MAVSHLPVPEANQRPRDARSGGGPSSPPSPSLDHVYPLKGSHRLFLQNSPNPTGPTSASHPLSPGLTREQAEPPLRGPASCRGGEHLSLSEARRRALCGSGRRPTRGKARPRPRGPLRPVPATAPGHSPAAAAPAALARAVPCAGGSSPAGLTPSPLPKGHLLSKANPDVPVTTRRPSACTRARAHTHAHARTRTHSPRPPRLALHPPRPARRDPPACRPAPGTEASGFAREPTLPRSRPGPEPAVCSARHLTTTRPGSPFAVIPKVNLRPEHLITPLCLQPEENTCGQRTCDPSVGRHHAHRTRPSTSPRVRWSLSVRYARPC